MSGASLTATNGPALHADGLTVNGDMHLRGGFQASSDSSLGTLRLSGATITGQLSLRNAEIRNTGATGLALDVNGAKVQGDLFLPLDAFPSDTDRPFRVSLDGFSYPFVPGDATLQDWLRLLAKHTSGYAAQPYQRLATVHRAAGHDRDVRRILIAQQIDHRRRGNLGNRAQKLLHRASGAFIGYGHRPWRALLFLAAACALAVVVTVSASLLGLAVHPTKTPGEPVTPCAPAEAIGLALDTSVPVLKLAGEKRCEIAATTGWGQIFYLASYMLQALGWAFTTLFVAGYTGLLRKTT
ncbi:hypothetical protein [Saccharopolyspora sp. NPDC050642]|uniref:hypothetical protein n=1 Tax=Saccharopolyspora sp. NPDC050642 TaxID=3157099 RepID=UPI0033E86672